MEDAGMSIVERLAEKWADVVQYGNNFMGGPSEEEERELTERDARWWLLAIVEELEAEFRYCPPGTHGSSQAEMVEWLREQADKGEG